MVQSADEKLPKKGVIVQKYGGSSVADVERLGRVADRVVAARAEGHDVVVVVSAMGKTTDQLLALARQVAAGGSAGAAQKEPPRRELDMLLSTGERVSMSLLSIAIQARDVPAISFTGSQSGILTNDRHFDARILEVRPHRIEDELSRGNVVIVAGYQGMSYRREITTLGRGGSDTTAVALAAALRAERCEIYSDVDGIYSADPRVVPDARHLPELDAALLQEMAECGAKVVCAQAVEWARRAGIAIYARSTFDPLPTAEARPRETIVRANPAPECGARAVVGEGSLALARFRGSRAPAAALDRVAAAAADSGLVVKDVSFDGRGGACLLPLLNVPDAGRALQTFGQLLDDVEVVRDVAAVSVVGDGLLADGRVMAKFLDALQPLTGAQHVFATPLRLTAVVGAGELAAAQRALHAAFVGA